MEIRFSRTGAERKALVEAVSALTGCEAVYQKAPSFAYVVQNYTIDKDGTLLWNERTDALEIRQLLAGLAAQGFVSEDSVPETDAPVVPCHEDAAPDRLSIEVPLEGFTETALANLEKLVASKSTLIRKAIGADALPIQRESDRLCFSWFPPDAVPEEIYAYTQLVVSLCDMAKKQKRVTAKEKAADSESSEKFSFRCFLLRLGFIGPEYASARKLLLRSLPGDSSFKTGKRKERDDTAPTAPQTADSGAVLEDADASSDEENTAANAATGGMACGDGPFSLAEALADAELIHNLYALMEAEPREVNTVEHP